MAVSTVLMIAGAAISAFSAIQQGRAQQSQANQQAQISEQQAVRETQVAAADESDFRVRQSRFQAQRRAAGGASGTVSGRGSNLLVDQDFAQEVELSALRIRTGGEVRATRLEQRAEQTRFAGKQASRAGFTRGGALLIGGIGSSKAFV